MPFAERFKELRKQKEMTQAQTAAALKVTKRTITNYEAGRNYPTMEVISRIEELFNVKIDLLLDSQDEFIAQAQEQYGYRGKRGAEKLVAEVGGLFAGGDLTETDKDAVMQALQEAYWDAKQRNKKYTPNKYKK